MAEKVVEKTRTNTIKERATAKAGPLPVWAWGVIIGGLVVWWWRRRQKNAAVDSTTTNDATTAVDSISDGDENQPNPVVENPTPVYGQPVLPSPTDHRTQPTVAQTGTTSKVGRKPAKPVNSKPTKAPFKGRPVYRTPETGVPKRTPIPKHKRSSVKAKTPAHPKETVDTRATVHGAHYYPGDNN